MKDRHIASVYVDKEEHKKMRSLLVFRGISFSSWVREKIREELDVAATTND